MRGNNGRTSLLLLLGLYLLDALTVLIAIGDAARVTRRGSFFRRETLYSLMNG
jgi:hypothetical protein